MSAAFTAAGASRMTFFELPDGRVLVVCPSCRFERMYQPEESPEFFEHVNSECPIAQLVIDALQEYRLGRGWEVHG